MGFMQLFVMPADGGTPRQLSQGDFNHPMPMFGGGLEWTPDGKHILLSANRRNESDLEIFDTEIYEFAVTDGKMKALTDRHGPDNIAEISPDGKFVAYTGYDEKYMEYQTTRLYIMNRDGSNPRCITKDFDRTVGSAKWAADGKGLYLSYDDTGRTRIGYVSLDGKRKELTDTLGNGRMAYGGAGAYAVAQNGNMAFTYSEPDHASDIAVLSAKNAKVRLITSVNSDIFGHKTLATVEEIWYKSSHDGRKIHGWIMKPPNFDPAKKYPLILEIHGGPWASYGEYFSIEKQLLASSGYVVLYTNPRGSTGYGYEFANLIHHDYPGNDYYDLMSGVDAMLEKDYIDKDNLFVTGGSGGGILSCWIIGKTDRFRAAATLYPVVNWYSTALTSDISFMAVKWETPGMPWDHVEHYMKRSPISLAGNVKTPTMVMCGEEDWRCPIMESEQYYMALKLQNIETVLVRFPNASHGINNRPSQHISKMQHIIAWFDQHKKQKDK
jgi:acylaminoacyl-peptidase